jgi:triacylglycerol lipase
MNFRGIACGTLIVAASVGCTRPPGHGGPTTTVPGPGTGHVPVVFVHGWGASGAQWSGVINQFVAKGYARSELSTISYTSPVAIVESAKLLEAEVARVRTATGAAKVDIVSYSMGSMIAKACIIIGDCKGRTAHWSSSSGVDNGTANEIPPARNTAAGDDVMGRTPLRQQLQDGWQEGIVDEGVKVQVHWSVNDEIVVPGDLSQEPPPAVNIAKPNLNHGTIYNDATVGGEIVAFLAA